MRRVKARFLVISFASDWLYPPVQSRELVRLLKRARVGDKQGAVDVLDAEWGEAGRDVRVGELALREGDAL